MKQSWWQLLCIQAGGTICLPVILVGQLVAQKFGWVAALLSIGLGNLFLLMLGYFLASLSIERRLSTVEHAALYFGRRGRWFFASLMMLSMLGWFGIQLNIMSESASQILACLGMKVSLLSLNAGMGLIISFIMCFGMKALKNLSYLSAPLLGITLLYTAFSTEGSIVNDSYAISWLPGVSLVIAANIGAVIDLPTFFRHAKSEKEAKLCILILYGAVVPFVELIGVYGGSTILEYGSLWTCCLVLLSGWQTNNANLYSAIASSYSLPGNFSAWTRPFILGGAGTVIACFNPLGNIEYVLDFLGITIGSMGAVILANYFIKTTPGVCFIGWCSGVIVGICGCIGAPAIDAFLTALLVQIILRRRYETVEY